MALGRIASLAAAALKTDKGKAVGRKVVDGAADAGRRASKGRHDSAIDKAAGAARKALGGDERGGEERRGDGTGEPPRRS